MDQFLLLMVPYLKGRTGERASLFRDYLCFRLRNPLEPPQVWPNDSKDSAPALPPFDCCNPRILPALEKPLGYSAEAHDSAGPIAWYYVKQQPAKPTKDDVDKYFALWRSPGIPDPQSFDYHRQAFLDWYRKHHPAQVSNKRRGAGAKGRASQRDKTRKSHSAASKPDNRKGAPLP